MKYGKERKGLKMLIMEDEERSRTGRRE